jgi:hypothetical protein
MMTSDQNYAIFLLTNDLGHCTGHLIHWSWPMVVSHDGYWSPIRRDPKFQKILYFEQYFYILNFDILNFYILNFLYRFYILIGIHELFCKISLTDIILMKNSTRCHAREDPGQVGCGWANPQPDLRIHISQQQLLVHHW